MSVVISKYFELNKPLVQHFMQVYETVEFGDLLTNKIQIDGKIFDMSIKINSFNKCSDTIYALALLKMIYPYYPIVFEDIDIESIIIHDKEFTRYYNGRSITEVIWEEFGDLILNLTVTQFKDEIKKDFIDQFNLSSVKEICPDVNISYLQREIACAVNIIELTLHSMERHIKNINY
jgi:hypothetical protein